MRNLDNQKNVIIFSVTRPNYSAEDEAYALAYCTATLNSTGCCVASCCEGRWQGQQEASVIVVIQPGYEDTILNVVLDLASYYEQESILLRDEQGVWIITVAERAQQRIGDALVQHTDPNTLPDNCTIYRDVVWVVK